MATAILIENGDDFKRQLSRTAKGYQGYAHYRVYAATLEQAITADGLPKIGDPWLGVPEFAGCKVVSIDSPERLGGHSDGDSSGVWWRVRVSYATPEGGSAFRVGGLGRKWTDLRIGQETAQVRFPIFRDSEGGGQTFATFDPIANGQGTTITLGRIILAVTVYQPLNQPLDLARIVSLVRPCKVNASRVQLPPFYDTTTPGPVFDPGQLLYLGPESVGVESGALKIVHIVQAAEDFMARWQPEDSNGAAVSGVTYVDTVYEAAEFGGLW